MIKDITGGQQEQWKPLVKFTGKYNNTDPKSDLAVILYKQPSSCQKHLQPRFNTYQIKSFATGLA